MEGRSALKRGLRVGLVFGDLTGFVNGGAELCEEASGACLERLDHGEVALLLVPSSAARKLFREAEKRRCLVGEGGPVVFLVSGISLAALRSCEEPRPSKLSKSFLTLLVLLEARRCELSLVRGGLGGAALLLFQEFRFASTGRLGDGRSLISVCSGVFGNFLARDSLLVGASLLCALEKEGYGDLDLNSDIPARASEARRLSVIGSRPCDFLLERVDEEEDWYLSEAVLFRLGRLRDRGFLSSFALSLSLLEDVRCTLRFVSFSLSLFSLSDPLLGSEASLSSFLDRSRA